MRTYFKLTSNLAPSLDLYGARTGFSSVPVQVERQAGGESIKRQGFSSLYINKYSHRDSGLVEW